MKTKIISLPGTLLVTSNASAQQQANALFSKISSDTSAVYTCWVFEAPNKMFGYDIFQNGEGCYF